MIISRDQFLLRIRGEYLEMPGLRLTPAQAQRLWGLDGRICAELLEALTREKFLYLRTDGTYARASEGLIFPPPRMAKAGETAAWQPLHDAKLRDRSALLLALLTSSRPARSTTARHHEQPARGA